jgi:Sporulation protein YtfJ (Spore_YtfJ)
LNDPAVPDELKQSIDRRAAGLSGSVMEKMANRLGQSAGVRTIYGEALERDGVTIIPVARLSWGIGGGSGAGNGPQGSGGGEGGGGGVGATPLGFVKIRGSEAEFQPIPVRPPLLRISLALLAAGLAKSLAFHGLRRFFRA